MNFQLPSKEYVLSIPNLSRLGLLMNGLIEAEERKLRIERERLKKLKRCTKGFDVRFGRRKVATRITEHLHDVVGIIYNDERDIIWRNDVIVRISDCKHSDDKYTLDRAFNGDGSFRWLSTLSKYATAPPKHNRLASIQYRMELITAAFLISGLYRPQIEGWDNPFDQ